MEVKKQKVISDSLFLASGHFILRLRGVVFIPIIVAAVGLEGYGAFIQIIINNLVILPIATMGLGLGFLRYTSKHEDEDIEHLSQDYWSVFLPVAVLSLLASLLVYLASPAISKYILSGGYLNSLRLSALMVLSGAWYRVDIHYIQSRKKFKLFSTYNIIYEFLPYLAFILGIIIKEGIFFGILLCVISQILLTLILKAYVIRELKYCHPSQKILLKFFKFSWALTLSNFTALLLEKVDRYFIGYFMGPTEIGIYNIVYAVCSLLDNIGFPLHKYFSVYLPKLWDEGFKDKVRAQLLEGMIYFLILAGGGLVGIVYLLRPAIGIFLDQAATTDTPFEWLALLIGLGIVFMTISKIFFHLTHYREQTYLQLIYQSIAVTINLGLNYFLVKTMGIMGAGIATLVSYTVVAMMCYFTLDLNIDILFVSKLLRIGLACVPLIFWFNIQTVYTLTDLGINIIVGLLIYLISIMLFRVVTWHEIKTRFI